MTSEIMARPKVDCSAPWQVVYIRAAKRLYTWTHVLVLDYAGRPLQQESVVPSCVPDWRYLSSPKVGPDISFGPRAL